MNRGLSVATLMACALGCEIPWSRPRPLIIDGEDREDYELQEEYERIQRKESKLSARDRRLVVFRWEKRQEWLREALPKRGAQ